MLYGVIDIGSNSVRLMLNDGIKTLYKSAIITRLAEDKSEQGILDKNAVERTVLAVKTLYNLAKENNADKIYAFATQAVRSAKNKTEFTSQVQTETSLVVDVVDGEIEAELGLIGALNGKDGGVIDIGGASTEIIVSKRAEIIYKKSVDIGVVSIKNKCAQAKDLVQEFVLKKITEFNSVPTAKFFGIGGTATSIASMMQELKVYDAEKVNGFLIDIDSLKILVEKLFVMSESDKQKIIGLQPQRVGVIAGGAQLLLSIMQKLGIKNLTVSENDNLEGYLKYVLEKR